MLFRQITHDDLGCASYLIGDAAAGVAAVVDPRYEIDVYLELARYYGVRIEHVLETHNHADHVSGHGRLVAATGARIHVHRLNKPDYEHEAFDDGWELDLGRVTVRALHTPGHRPEHTCFLLSDHARGESPWAVLSGDSLFVGDTARTDLAIETVAGARQIFRSLQEKLLPLPDDCEIWPAHLGGSMCGSGRLDLKICSTIGFERRNNPVLAIEDEDEFVRLTTAGLGPQPPNFRRIVELNHGELLTLPVEAPALYPHQVERRRLEGAMIVDVRTDLQFDSVHIAGAISIPTFGPGFGSKLAWLADPGREVVFVGRDDADAQHAARLAASVGVHEVAGVLAGGMTNWRQERHPVQRTERLDVPSLRERLHVEPDLQVLDVRERSEWDTGHIPGSLHTPWHDLQELPAELDTSRPIATICAGGVRAGTAASLLRALGAERVLHVVDGGVARWADLGGELVGGRTAPTAAAAA